MLSLLLAASLALAAPPAPPLDVSLIEGRPQNGVEAPATPSQTAVVAALSVREPKPTCETVSALTETPAIDLVWVVEHVNSPPWAGMIAAECVILSHAVQARPTLERWLTEPQLKGLGWSVLKHLDELPLEAALALATLAIQSGPDPTGARKRVGRAKTPEIKALAAE
jgi:hypothetical protein